MDEKRKKGRKEKKENKKEIPVFREYCFSFLLKPWRRWTRPLPWLRRVTCKALQNKGL
jgi:hypothetical protein